MSLICMLEILRAKSSVQTATTNAGLNGWILDDITCMYRLPGFCYAATLLHVKLDSQQHLSNNTML